MTHEEYAELYQAALLLDENFKPVQIPIEPLPGETTMGTILRFMRSQDMIELDGDNVSIKDRSKIINYDPNLMKIIEAIWKADANANLDRLEEIGLLYTTVDEEGNIIRELTDAGRAAIDEDN